MKLQYSFIVLFLILCTNTIQAQQFVHRKGKQFFLDGKPYYYIGTNYWYGGLLGLEKDEKKGIKRLQCELDFLKKNGVTNLRIVAGAEGEGLVSGVQRIRPALQSDKGVFNEDVLKGIDILLNEVRKREMRVVLFLSNNWEWSGGFLQYLRWNDQIPDSIFRNKMEWELLRDYTSKFYTCEPCKDDYLKQVELLLNRTNSITQKKYRDDPAIMAWELANEPRPMRPVSNTAYKNWINEATAFIKSRDKNHLVTIGHEGLVGSDSSLAFFKDIHATVNVDYVTIHIWPKNWGWLKEATMETDFPMVIKNTTSYIDTHVTVAHNLNKPLVIEEFGLPRDFHSFKPGSPTTLRDKYYNTVFSIWENNKINNGIICGINFWAFGGIAKPVQGQVYWKPGDAYMGDPPMEEQGLNTVFSNDITTWKLIKKFALKK